MVGGVVSVARRFRTRAVSLEVLAEPLLVEDLLVSDDAF